MELDILNNVEIQVKDKDTGEIKQTVKKHNKATRNLVYGALKFLSGVATTDSNFNSKKYIPCYVGFGNGGIEESDEAITPDPNWTETVNYNDTHLVREIPNSRSRIRKQTNTFQKHSGNDSNSAGDMDSVIFYSEISPSSLCERKLVEHEVEVDGDTETVTEDVMIPRIITELGLFADNDDSDSMLAHVKFSNDVEFETVEREVVKQVDREVERTVEKLVPYEVERQVEKTIEYNVSHREDFGTDRSVSAEGTVLIPVALYTGQRARLVKGDVEGVIHFIKNVYVGIHVRDDSNGNLICVRVETAGEEKYVNVGDIVGTVDYDSRVLSFDTNEYYMQVADSYSYNTGVIIELYYTRTETVTETYVDYEVRTVTETIIETVPETIIETELVPIITDDTNLIYLKPNYIMTIKWVVTIAAIGPNNIFDNRFIYDENGKPIDNTYNDIRKSLSNIIVVSDSNNT